MIKKNLFIPILLFLTGCLGETHCPEYPGSKLSWLPYQLDNLVKFSNNNDTISFIINDNTKSNAYSFKKNCKCACEADAQFKTNVNDQIDLKIAGRSIFFGIVVDYQYTFIKYGGDLYSALRSDNFHFSEENDKISEEVIAEYYIADMVYKNVIIIELDTIDDYSFTWQKPEIWRLLVAESIGIIQFEDCKTREVWKRVN